MIKIFLVLTILAHFELYSQLTIDAGIDRVICRNSSGTLGYPRLPYYWSDTLGGSPTATNGTPPYIYKWEVNYYSKTASFYLNDSTIANPVFKRDSLKIAPFNYFEGYFYLTVTDNAGNSKKDSFRVLSGGNFKAFDGNDAIKKKNDTILKCSNVSSADVPLTYLWRPNIFITDSTIRCPKFFNPNDTQYYCQVTDKYGCYSGFIKSTFIEIDNTNSIISNELRKIFINFHNPVFEKSIFYFIKPNNIEKINIYNNLGQKIYTQNHSDILELGRHIKEKGFYYIVIFNNQHTISPIKIQKE